MTLFGSANIHPINKSSPPLCCQPINKKWTTYQCPQLSFNPKTGIYLKEISFKSFGVNKILRIIQSGNHPVRKLSNLLPTWFSSLTVRQPIEAPPTFSHQLTSNQLITIQSLPGSVHWQFGKVDQSETLPSCCHQRLFPLSPVSIQIYSFIRSIVFRLDSYWTLLNFSMKYKKK